MIFVVPSCRKFLIIQIYNGLDAGALRPVSGEAIPLKEFPMTPITYTLEPDLTAHEFRDVLVASTLAERRPVTDFSFCCYLSDLAVDAAYQSQGIG